MSLYASTFILALYFVLFAVIHSLLADPRFKHWIRRVLGTRTDRWYRLSYSLLAVFMTLPFVVALYLYPGETLYIVPSPWRWLMVFGQILAALGLAKAFLETGPLQFLGLKSEPEGGGELIVRGLYCRTRNPLFFFALVLLWLTPFMTLNLLVLYLLATVYFYLGAIHEERTLAVAFGEAYLKYKKEVPRIVPRPRCRYPETGAQRP